MFPLMLLIVTIASAFFDSGAASSAVIAYSGKYLPLSAEMQTNILKTITEAMQSRGKTGGLAFIMLVWAAAQFFTTITHATNGAWGSQSHNWWRSPLQNIALLTAIIAAAFIGIAVPILGEMAGELLNNAVFFSKAYSLLIFFVPWIVLFFSLGLIYKFAPRRITLFSEVWFSAVCATALLYAAQSLFVLYLKSSPAFNTIYGTFGAIIALMLWIYLSGAIFIFCACLCAAQAETAKA